MALISVKEVCAMYGICYRTLVGKISSAYPLMKTGKRKRYFTEIEMEIIYSKLGKPPVKNK